MFGKGPSIASVYSGKIFKSHRISKVLEMGAGQGRDTLYLAKQGFKIDSLDYSKKAIELQDVEYTISGYSNTKTKVFIKQSKYHIVIEPNNNGFDKYLIQDIIQDYARSQILNICKKMKLFKIVVIDKIDNLNYYAQASLRRTMEKYANTCKFIFISNQLSKIIEPLKNFDDPSILVKHELTIPPVHDSARVMENSFFLLRAFIWST